MNTPTVTSPLFLTRPSFSIKILLVDDQQIVVETLKKMLKGESIEFFYCLDPTQALAMAAQIKPTVILQDLVMPDMDGLLLVKYYRSHPATKDVPIIVLSSREDPQVKAESFALGANDYIVKLPDRLELLARIRYHSNAYIRLLERNEAFKKLDESQKVLQKELSEAAEYVHSLLPVPLKGDISIDWRFIPSTQLGGDVFGYHWLDDRFFAIYLLDVCGHGIGAALLSISVLNVLRSNYLPKVDYRNPASVLEELNLTFQMENHHDMFFTIWYGVFDREKNEIIYSSGGHPPALLFMAEAETIQLTTGDIAIGAIKNVKYHNAVCKIKPLSRLYLFSDGVFEVQKPDGIMFTCDEFVKYLNTKPLNLNAIVEHIKGIQGKQEFEDDFSIVEIKFD